MAPLQVLTLFLCFLIVAADGFDVASVGYVAPLLRREWSMTAAQLGPIFGAGLFGLTLGSLALGPLADRIGRKRIILVSLVLFGIGSIACAWAPSPAWLIALRFATGAGLGGALPSVTTLWAEFSPARNRSLLVAVMLSGFPLGLAFGGAVAAKLIPAFGWKGVFIFGGAFPLALVPLVWMLLPESLKFMAGKPRYAEEAHSVLKRLTGSANTAYPDAAADLRGAVEAGASGSAQGSPLSIVFNTYFRAGTLLMWVCFFCTLWVYYQLSSWLPTVINDAGIDVSRAALVSMMLPLGGALGAIMNAWLMDRMSPFKVLTWSYVAAAVFIPLIGMAIHQPTLVYLTVFLSGVGLAGAQTGIIVMAAGFYTTAARATGVSMAFAVGRVGSIIGAMTGGLLIAAVPSVEVAFQMFAVPTVIAGIAMALIGWLYRGKVAQ